MAYIVMACTVMIYVVMAYEAMAYLVMAHTAVASRYCPGCRRSATVSSQPKIH